MSHLDNEACWRITQAGGMWDICARLPAGAADEWRWISQWLSLCEAEAEVHRLCHAEARYYDTHGNRV
jgi:hypothetical protein